MNNNVEISQNEISFQTVEFSNIYRILYGHEIYDPSRGRISASHLYFYHKFYQNEKK